MRPVDLLRELADDGRAGGVGELGQLAQMLVGQAPGAGPLERRADEQRPLDGRGDDDRFAAYARILVEIIVAI